MYGESNSSGWPVVCLLFSSLSLFSRSALSALSRFRLGHSLVLGCLQRRTVRCKDYLLAYLLTYVQASEISVENNVYFDHIIHIESQCNKAVIKTYRTVA